MLSVMHLTCIYLCMNDLHCFMSFMVHEKKAKRIKKIKSGTFHRRLKKDRLKAESSRIEMDSEVAMKQYFKRAEVLKYTSGRRVFGKAKAHVRQNIKVCHSFLFVKNIN